MKIKNASLVRNTKFDEKGVQIAGIFARLQYKINRDIKNNTQEVLPLDILRLHVKRDLLYITVATLEEVILDILRFPERFEENNVHVTIRSLIKKIAEKFLAKHYGCEIELSSQFLKRSRYVTSLLNDNELLYTTPLRTLLNPNNATFRSLFSPIYSYASETFIEALLDNLIIYI